MSFRLGQEVRSFLFKRSLMQRQNAVRAGQRLAIVRGNEECRIGLPHEVGEKREDLLASLVVQVAGRLVGEDEERVVSQGTSDGYPLLFSPGQPVRKTISSVEEADVIEHRLGPFLGGRRRVPSEFEGQEHVLDHREGRDQVKRLEDKSDMRPPKERPIRFGKLREVGPVNHHLSSRGEIDSTYEIEESTFAGPASSHENDGRTPVDGQGYLPENRPIRLRLCVGFREINQLKEGTVGV